MPRTTVEMSDTLAKLVRLFIATANMRFVVYYSKRFTNMKPAKLVADEGLRYVRIWRQDGDDSTGRSAYCFIDKTTGDILKAASWKKPAKHARGNLYKTDWLPWVSPYGTAYLKGTRSYSWGDNLDETTLSIARDAILNDREDDAFKLVADAIQSGKSTEAA